MSPFERRVMHAYCPPKHSVTVSQSACSVKQQSVPDDVHDGS